MPDDTDRIRATIAAQGRRLDWVASQMGISPSYLTRLLDGERRWTSRLRARITAVLGVPEGVLFFAPDYRRTDDAESSECITQEAP